MRKIFIGVLAIITCLVALIWFVCCFTPYISPVDFWPMAFLALAFPYLAPVIMILAICWILIDRKVGLLLSVLFIAAFQNLFATFALNPTPKSTLNKPAGTIRILTWNVRG